MRDINFHKFDIDDIVNKIYAAKTFTSNKKLTDKEMLDIIKESVYKSLSKYHEKLMAHLKI